MTDTTARKPVITGTGFQRGIGGFEIVYVDGVSYSPRQIREGLRATPAQPGDSLSANMTSVTDFSDAEVKPDTGDVAALREEYSAAFKIASDLHAAYEKLIYGLPKYLEDKCLTDEENMIREAFITLDVTAHRLAALSKPNAPGREG